MRPLACKLEKPLPKASSAGQLPGTFKGTGRSAAGGGAALRAQELLPGRICEKVQIFSVLNFKRTESFRIYKCVILDNQLIVTYPARQDCLPYLHKKTQTSQMKSLCFVMYSLLIS